MDIDSEAILAFGLGLKALIDYLKAIDSKRLKDGCVIVLLIVLALLFAAVLSFTLLAPVRLFVYTALLLVMTAIGVDTPGRHWVQKKRDEAQAEVAEGEQS